MTSVGIDVSKGKSTVCIFKPYGEVVASPYEIEHTEAEISALVSHIRAIDGEIRIVMEAGLFVSIINLLAMKKYASIAIRKGKTDKIDFVRIANYGIDNWFKLSDYNVPDEIYAQLRLLGRQYAHYILSPEDFRTWRAFCTSRPIV